MLQYTDHKYNVVQTIDEKDKLNEIIQNRHVFDAHFKEYWLKKYGSSASLKIPIMGFKELDLFRLLQETLYYGGYYNVIMKTGSWSKIWKKLPNYDPSITDSSFRLKKNYEKFLLEYENIYFSNYKSKGIDDSLRTIHHSNNNKDENVNNNDKDSNVNSVNSGDSTLNEDVSLFDYKSQKSSLDIPQLPMNIDNLTLIDIGHVIPKYPFVDGDNIWPVYYRCACTYMDIDDVSKESLYINTINRDKNDNIRFEVYIQDKPERVFVGSSPQECWSQIEFCIISRLHKDYNMNSLPSHPNGIKMFGLDHPTIKGFLIKQLKKFSCNNNEKMLRKRRYNKRKRFDPSLTCSREWKRAKDLKYTFNEAFRMDYDHHSFELDSHNSNSFEGEDICYLNNDYFTTTKFLSNNNNSNNQATQIIHYVKELHPPTYEIHHYHGKDDYTKEYFSPFNFEFSQRGGVYQNF